MTAYDTARSLSRHVGTIIGIGPEIEAARRKKSIWNQYITVNSVAHELIGVVNDLAQQHKNATVVLLPADDESVEEISRHREQLDETVRFLLPDKSTVQRLLNKSEFHEFALMLGFDVPNQVRVTRIEELASAMSTMRLPLLLKPRFRDTKWNDAFPEDKVIVLTERAADLSTAQKALDLAGELIVQELIPGEDKEIYFVLGLYGADGQNCGCLAGRKLFQWPPHYGSTAVAVSGAPKQVTEIGLRFLDQAGLIGLGSIEMKYDERDRKYVLIEPTIGRNDHQSYLATAANCNLTLAAVTQMTGERSSVQPERRSMWIDSVAVLRLCRVYGVRPLVEVLREWPSRRLAIAMGFGRASSEVAALIRSSMRKREPK